MHFTFILRKVEIPSSGKEIHFVFFRVSLEARLIYHSEEFLEMTNAFPEVCITLKATSFPDTHWYLTYSSLQAWQLR